MKIIWEYFARSGVDFIGRNRLPSFADCILGCHGSLYRYARSLCGDPWDADELLQETYKRALAARRKPVVVTADEIRPWAFTIMRHIWQNERRRVSRSQEMQFEDESSVPDEGAERALSRELLLSDVRAAVDSLPVPWREIIVMRDIEDFSYAQIAAALGCPIGTVMSRLARARAALRRILTGRVPTTRDEVRR
ncbi:MAG TPA: RNA polymerase sigma factor [Bryobacteraceae bacterium]|nr:RNA polymerase sigma factor [Bryobacteraceae bacterium]